MVSSKSRCSGMVSMLFCPTIYSDHSFIKISSLNKMNSYYQRAQYQFISSLPHSYYTNATYIQFSLSQTLFLDAIIYNSQNGPGVAINNPTSQWLSHIFHQHRQQATGHVSCSDKQVSGAAIFSKITKRGGKSLEGATPAINSQTQRHPLPPPGHEC